MDKKSTPSIELQQIETVLGRTLVPIAPRVEFASRLQGRLERTDDQDMLILAPGADRRRITLIGLASALTIIALILAGYRTVAALMSGLGLLHEAGEQIKSRRTPPLKPAG